MFCVILCILRFESGLYVCCFFQYTYEFEILIGRAAAVIEGGDLFLEHVPVVQGRRGVVIPELIIRPLELPLDFLVTDKGDADFSFYAAGDFFNPFDISFHRKIPGQRCYLG